LKLVDVEKTDANKSTRQRTVLYEKDQFEACLHS